MMHMKLLGTKDILVYKSYSFWYCTMNTQSKLKPDMVDGVYQYGPVFDGFFIQHKEMSPKTFFRKKNRKMVCRSLRTT